MTAYRFFKCSSYNTNQ